MNCSAGFQPAEFELCAILAYGQDAHARFFAYWILFI